MQAIVVEQAKFIASFFFVPVVLGLNWRRGTREGAIWSMVAGFLGCLVWTFTLQRSFARHGIDAVEVGVALSAVTFILVSRATPPTPEENLRDLFRQGLGLRLGLGLEVRRLRSGSWTLVEARRGSALSV